MICETRRRLHAIHVGVRQGLRVRIGERRGAALLLGHRVETAPVMLGFHCYISVALAAPPHAPR